MSSVSALAVQHRRWLSILVSFCKSEPWGEIKSGFHNGVIKHRTDFTGQSFTSKQTETSDQQLNPSSTPLDGNSWVGWSGDSRLLATRCTASATSGCCIALGGALTQRNIQCNPGVITVVS